MINLHLVHLFVPLMPVSVYPVYFLSLLIQLLGFALHGRWFQFPRLVQVNQWIRRFVRLFLLLVLVLRL